MCLEILRDSLLVPNARALDIGSGSGYMVSCMAYMMQSVHNDGKVFGIEHIPELAEQSIINIKNDHPEFIESDTAHIIGTYFNFAHSAICDNMEFSGRRTFRLS